MSPKEKALEIFDKCYYKIEDATAGLFENDVDYLTARRKAAQWCALITSDECYNEAYKQATEISLIRQDYWQAVKAEIEKL